jgi:hypothetical protein
MKTTYDNPYLAQAQEVTYINRDLIQVQEVTSLMGS